MYFEHLLIHIYHENAEYSFLTQCNVFVLKSQLFYDLLL